LASEDPGRADLECRLLGMAWDFEVHLLTLYNVAETPIDVRRNWLDRQGAIGVLRIRPVESWPDLFPTMLTAPSGDAKERDVGGARPEHLEGLRMPSKQLGFCLGDLVKKGIELCTLLGTSLRRAQ